MQNFQVEIINLIHMNGQLNKLIKINALFYLIIISLFSSWIQASNEIEEVIVTGSHIAVSNEQSSPVEIISSADLENLNVSTVAEISKYLSSSSGSHFQTNAMDGVDQGMSSITLRGLDQASTLLLINSRRQTFSGTPSHEGEGYIDANIIPKSAIERIEILKEGGTSLYGSDAVSGVINFITHKNFEGVEISTASQGTENYNQDEHNRGILLGKNFESSNITIAANFLSRSSLSASEIPGIAELGISTLGNTFILTKKDEVMTGDYQGKYSAGQKIPDPMCLTNGGIIEFGFCKFKYGERFNIVNDEDHKKFYLNLYKDLKNFSFNSTLITSDVDVNDNPQSPSYPALSFLSRLVQPDQGGNPFNVPVRWFGRPLAAAFPSPFSPKDIFQYHFSNSFYFDLRDNLDLQISLTKSKHTNKHYRPDIINSRFENAIDGIGGPNGDQKWNLIESSANSDSLIKYLRGAEISKKIGGLTSLNSILRNSNKTFDIAFGMQLDKETLDITYDDLSRAEFDNDGKMLKTANLLFLGGGKNVTESRNKKALFAEVSKNFNNNFNLLFAGRYERLDNFSSFDPKISLRFNGKKALIRGSIGNNFVSPSMAQKYSSDIQLGSVRYLDETPFVRQALLGNPSLKASTSQNVNIGLIYELHENLKVTLDYWRIDYKNRIEVESAQQLILSDPFNQAITRDALGNITGISTSYINEEETKINGLDFSLNYEHNLVNLGDFKFKIQGTTLHEFLTPEDIDQGNESINKEKHQVMINRVGKFNYDSNTHSLPKLRLNAFSSLETGGLRIGLNIRYIDGYKNLTPINTKGLNLGYKNIVDSFTVYDLSARKNFVLNKNKMSLELAIINLFDKKAPRLYDAPDFSFDTRVHDPRGKLLQINFKISR